MAIAVNLTVTDSRYFADLEARPVVAAYAAKIIASRTANARPQSAESGRSGESAATVAFRTVAGARVAKDLLAALQQEEWDAINDYQVIEGLSGADLDSYGSGTWGVTRGTDPVTGDPDDDATYRADIHAVADLEQRPLRKALADAFEAAVDTVLASGAVSDLIDQTMTDLSGTM